MSSGGRSPVYRDDAILRQACFSALLISVVIGVLSVLGLILRPHGLWAVPIGSSVLSLSLALRLRRATTPGTVVVLSVVILVLVVVAGWVAGLAARIRA